LSGPRCRSAAIQTTPGRVCLLGNRGFFDDDVFNRHVLVEAFVAGAHGFDLVHDLGAVDHLAEHGVAPAVGGGGGEVQEVVVGHVDEELGGGGMRIGSTGHGDGVLVVLQAVVGFVLDGGFRGLLLHAGFEAAALDHEVVDHAVKHGAVVEAAVHVVQEVGDRVGSLFGVQFDNDVALVRLQFDARGGAHGFTLGRG